MTARAAYLQDVIDEALSCGDPDCSCKRGLEDVREELEALTFHECGFAYSVHDNIDRYAKGPFGCPTEAIARARWGR